MKKGYMCMFFAFAVLSTLNSLAQTCSPNCVNINASVLYNSGTGTYYSVVNWTDIISNYSCSGPVDYQVLTRSGRELLSGNSGGSSSFTIQDACQFNDGVKVFIENGLGGCWSEITFKKGAPVIMGRRVSVYCDHPMVSDPSVLIDDTKPTAFVTCVGSRDAEFAADWVFAKECDPGVQDTVKQILREWEFHDKDGRRAVAYDTIDVMLFPEIDDNHLYCQDRDTVYCGIPTIGVGPFFTYDSLNTGICDTIYFVEISDEDEDGMLEFSSTDFDSKCGLAIHVDSEKFGNECETIYKVSVDIKQDCYGTAQSAGQCPVVPPVGVAPNMAQQIAPGYWRCTFWLTDLDTVPPKALPKFDDIDEDRVLWSNVIDDVGFGSPTTHCFTSTQGAPIVVVPTSSHECDAHTYIPPICVYDDWSGVKQAKASIPGFGSFSLSSNDEDCEIIIGLDTCIGKCYESHTTVKLPKSEEPYQILYEIYDNCHNIDSVYAYLYIKDLVKPVPVLDKRVTVSLGGKKSWVKAETFDEGSWDNCGINMILARRQDWKEACIDLCDSVRTCCVTEHHDTLRMAFLQPDKHLDEVEAHYVKTLDWLRNDGVPCGNLIYNAWQYDLMKYATLNCVEHPYSVDDDYFRKIFLQCYEDYLYGDHVNNTESFDINPETPVEYCFDRWGFVDPYFSPGCEEHVTSPEGGLVGLNQIDELLESEKALVNLYETIGGGWAEDVPFSCDDACGPVKVEVLVIDYWCNFSIAWTNVWVEDRIPAQVAQDVVDGTISCKAFKTAEHDVEGEDHPVSIQYIVDQAKDGSDAAMNALDDIFGGYEKAWKDAYNNYVDIDGNPVGLDIAFPDSVCECSSDIEYVRVFDDHLGYIWKDSLITDCYYTPDTSYFQQGVVVANCDTNVYCDQTVWCDIDHCGEGFIYRKFKIWQGCPASFYDSDEVPDSIKHPVDTIFRIQKIEVSNECGLSKYMFDVPGDTTISTCGLEYDPNGSGNLVGEAGPENTGQATYIFEDDDCRLVGIGHEDKVFDIVGGDEFCKKIIRTWYFADWCAAGGTPLEGSWWIRNSDFVVGSCEQKILIYDSSLPECTISGPADENGILEVGSCDLDLSFDVTATDACGLTEYYWQIKDIRGGDAVIADEGYGDLEGDSVTFTIAVEGLLHSEYLLKVQVVDDCNNESYCEYAFTAVSAKKPTPICVTSLTAELVGYDSDSDGDIDGANNVVWAAEFDQSSQAACGESNDSLDFYVEFVTGDESQDVFDIDRVADSILVTCEHIGTRMVRMWVYDRSVGSADYCDVLVVTQNNTMACEAAIIENAGSLMGTIEDEAGNVVELVQVMAESNLALNSISSGTDGTFEFEAQMGAEVILTPRKNINPTNGINTNDLVLLLNHVTGAEKLASSYRELAADANRDGEINALDLLDLRQLILGEIERLPNSDSWRFTVKDYEFTTDNPASENVPEHLTISMDEETMYGNFIGMKVGDMDLDNNPKLKAPRGAEQLVFTTSDMMLEAGKTYDIPMSATSFRDIAGYQYTLQVNEEAATIAGFSVNGSLEYLDENNFGKRHLADGMLTTSWNATSKGASAEWGETIYTVKLIAKQNVRLSDVLAIGGKLTGAESYQYGKRLDVSLEFDALNLGDEVTLFQNRPNPARTFTNIEFYLPSEESIKLIITDVAGKTIKRFDGVYPRGKHSIALEKDELPAGEVYFYSLVAGDEVKSKKMVFVR